MLYKTRGIVLRKIKYSETSIIAYTYTETFGRQAYLVKGARKKSSKIKANFFQPLFLLEMEIYHNPNRELQTIKEVFLSPPLKSIPDDLLKKSIAIFIAEVIYRSIKQEMTDRKLFIFLNSAIHDLDNLLKNISNFHLYFLVRLTKYLGFYPTNNYSSYNRYFDLLNGNFTNIKPSHNQFISSELSLFLFHLMNNKDPDLTLPGITSVQRIALVEKLIEYFRIHIENFGTIRSIEVFRELFHDNE
jgi:DNA repair protein RecO (recombination protein O)